MIDKLGFLKGGSEGMSASPEEERLMQLFQNRAGLKKTYADLKDEFHLLRDRLKQQEGATMRLQEQLESLAELLADPRTGFGVIVFYQLRGLWKTCHQQLSVFATDLARQQEARESARYQLDSEASQNAALAAVDQRLNEAARNAAAEHERLAGALSELNRLTAFWHYFERRRRRHTLVSLRNGAAGADAALSNLNDERGAVSRQSPAPFPGISLAAKRTINLAIIGYAELLCDHVDAFGLALRAKEAVARRVHEMTFGSRSDCEGYMQRVQKAQAAVSDQTQVTAMVKSKLERLRAVCEYRNAADTIPTADSLAAGPKTRAGRSGMDLQGAGAGGSAQPWNVLAEDFWDVNELLLR